MTPFDSFTFTPFEVGVPFESVTFPGVDGTALPGWWLYHPDSRRVVIICGGYRGHRADMLGIAAALWRDGNNVLIFDYRGHGELAGTPVTLGYQEVEDLLGGGGLGQRAHLRRLDRRDRLFDGRLGRHHGQRHARRTSTRWWPTALLRYSAAPSASPCGGVLHIPHAPLLHLVDFLLGHVGGYHFRDVEPVREVGLVAPRPLLLIHGEADSVTDPRDTRVLYEAASEPKELWMTPGVEHCGTYFHDRAYYCDRVAAFFHRALSKVGDEDSSAGVEARSAR